MIRYMGVLDEEPLFFFYLLNIYFFYVWSIMENESE